MISDPSATSVDPSKFQHEFNTLLQGRMKEQAELAKTAGIAYMEKMSQEKNAIKTESGLIFQEISK
eukprot:Awhi_evm1s9476